MAAVAQASISVASPAGDSDARAPVAQEVVELSKPAKDQPMPEDDLKMNGVALHLSAPLRHGDFPCRPVKGKNGRESDQDHLDSNTLGRCVIQCLLAEDI